MEKHARRGAAIRHPWRMALSYVYTLLGKERLRKHLPLFKPPGQSNPSSEEKIRILLQQIDRRVNSSLTSSCGRLFDGVSALVGLCPSVSFERQAAMELEMIADPNEMGSYEFLIQEEKGRNIVRLQPLIEGILQDLEKGADRSRISGKFHHTLVKLSLAVCQKIRDQGGPGIVALSGGVFQNRLLSERMRTVLEEAGFRVLVPRQVPCNDGGLSLGQAVIANFVPL